MKTNEGTPNIKLANVIDNSAPSIPLDAPQVANIPVLTQSAFDTEMSKYKLEAARLEVLEKQANLQDLHERLAERDMKRVNKFAVAKTNGQTLVRSARDRALIQKRCNHKKGGNGANGVVGGQGDDSQYAVLKHIMANRDTWIRCLRCGKWWIPPVESDFETTQGYNGALIEYQTALNFTTRNVTSGSCLFGWGDNGDYFRQLMKNTINT